MRKHATPGLIAGAVFAKIAEGVGLKAKIVKVVITPDIVQVAFRLKNNGMFKLGGVHTMELKKKPCDCAQEWHQPSHQGALFGCSRPSQRAILSDASQ